jgi:hypothetical protein
LLLGIIHQRISVPFNFDHSGIEESTSQLLKLWSRSLRTWHPVVLQKWYRSSHKIDKIKYIILIIFSCIPKDSIPLNFKT